MRHHSGIWIWNLSKLRKDYLNDLNQVQCQRVYLKVLDDKTDGIFWGWQCTPEIISIFESHGIEVWGWGYIFDERSSTDTFKIIDAIKRAVNCGIKGFVFDIEEEVKDKATHSQLQEILKQAKAIIPPGGMGYTSFGAPTFHTNTGMPNDPGVPYKMLNELCDLQFPQIYFEKFDFGEGSPGSQENSKEVTACLKQHEELGLDKPILPMWGSESDSKHPASANELQNYLTQYPGSSIFRAPNAGEVGEAWNCNYNYSIVLGIDELTPEVRSFQNAPLPLPFTRELKLGEQGEDVYQLLCALMELGFLKKDKQVTDVFNTNVDGAVRWAQRQHRMNDDGIVEVITKSSLENALLDARIKPVERSYQAAPLPLPFTRELKLGEQGEDVYQLLCALMELGFLKKDERVTDVFNINVDGAVRLAQRRYRMNDDGIVEATTKSSLEDTLQRTRVAPVERSYQDAPIPLPFTRDLKLGAQGGDVYQLLCALMELGFLKKDGQVTDVFNTPKKAS